MNGLHLSAPRASVIQMGKKSSRPIVPLPAGGLKAPSGGINKQRKDKGAKKTSHGHSVAKEEEQAPDVATSLAVAPPPLPTREQLVAAEDRCYDAQHVELNVGVHAPAAARRAANNDEPLAAEIERGEALRRLRLSFAESARKLQLSAPVGAFERWHFGWLLASARTKSTSALDPLLPMIASPEADQALIDELKEAGAPHDNQDAALAAMDALRESAQAEAARLAASLARKLAPDPDEITLQTSEGERGAGGGGGLSHLGLGGLMPKPLKISNEWLAKLRAMHVGDGEADEKVEAAEAEAAGAEAAAEAEEEQAAAEAEGRFRRDLARLLLRYKAIGGSGFQAALGGGTFAVLRTCFGTTMEMFASPLNARSSPFCSAFVDTDSAFGSLGSFLDLRPESGAFEANPPFVPLVIDAMCEHMEQLLSNAESKSAPLLFAVVVGASAALKRHAAWQRMQQLAASRFGRAQWLVALHSHGYTEGHAHICKGGAREARRMSSCDTVIFIWASSAGAAKWPPTAVAEQALRAAMKATVPRNLHKASKANKMAHAAKKKQKRQRQRQGK